MDLKKAVCVVVSDAKSPRLARQLTSLGLSVKIEPRTHDPWHQLAHLAKSFLSEHPLLVVRELDGREHVWNPNTTIALKRPDDTLMFLGWDTGAGPFFKSNVPGFHKGSQVSNNWTALLLVPQVCAQLAKMADSNNVLSNIQNLFDP